MLSQLRGFQRFGLVAGADYCERRNALNQAVFWGKLQVLDICNALSYAAEGEKFPLAFVFVTVFLTT